MSWLQKQQEFQNRFDTLALEDVQGLLTNLKTATGNYINKGGLNQDPASNPDYNTIVRLSQKAEDLKNKYAALNNDILEYLKNASQDNNLSDLLTKNGKLQQQIQQLQKVEHELKDDVESAVARDELLRSRNTDISSHKLFLLDRPVRRGMIPYLWVFSILFIGIGLVIFKMMFPTVAAGYDITYLSGMIYEFFSNQMVLFAFLGVAILTIVLLSLKVAGIF